MHARSTMHGDQQSQWNTGKKSNIIDLWQSEAKMLRDRLGGNKPGVFETWKELVKQWTTVFEGISKDPLWKPRQETDASRLQTGNDSVATNECL
ncbi:hypothetical protein AJ80_09976 [Polytolypa hystricis UAMH7299]|uniref:Uncharacterized protein n=1 Tax=Polytolypa hystricis (strain UAMH7299) TaxID=1447883 RepID=A0A2B7W747_POLH7|nr:hypothetical protein AJ80_09976 [Polytolypa hystricis UAMH7299]